MIAHGLNTTNIREKGEERSGAYIVFFFSFWREKVSPVPYRIEKRCLLYASRTFVWTVFLYFRIGGNRYTRDRRCKIAFWQVWTAISFGIYIYIETISNRSSKDHPFTTYVIRNRARSIPKLFDPALKLVPLIRYVIRIPFLFDRFRRFFQPLFRLVSSFIITREKCKRNEEAGWKEALWNKQSSGTTVFMVRRNNGSKLTVLLFYFFCTKVRVSLIY